MPCLATPMGRAIVGRLQGASGPPALPSLISAAIRSSIPEQSSSQPFGALQTNRYSYTQYRDQPVRAVNGIRTVYANIGVSSITALPAYIDSGRQEQGISSTIGLRFTAVTSIGGATADQTGATFTPGTFADAANDAAITVGSQTVTGAIWKLDNSTSPPTITRRTYAQFVSDGGSVIASTVNAVSLPNSQIFVPRGYLVISDAGANLPALTPYYLRYEEDTPVITVTSIDGTVAGTTTVLTANTDRVRVGDVGTVANGTGNTSHNGTWQVTAVVANTSIALNSPTSTSGAVGGTPLLRFAKPTGSMYAMVSFNNLGDYTRTSLTQRDVMGSSGANWVTGVGGNVLADNQLLGGFAAVLGTDPTGGKSYIIYGDSQAFGIGDRQTNSPSAIPLGDSVGNLGWINRMMYANRLPSIRTAVPGMKAKTALANNDDKFRLWFGQFADRALDEMGRNDALDGDPYATFSGNMQTHWTRSRTSLRNEKYVIGVTLTGSTTSATDLWTTARSVTYQTQSIAVAAYPSGYIWANFNPSFGNGTFVTGAAGGVDGFIDQAQMFSNMNGSVVAINGYHAVDGVSNYKYTVDGSHASKDGHTSVAAQCTPSVLQAAKLIP